MNEISFGEKVKRARLKIGWTQTELAYNCRLGLRTVQRIENNEVVPRIYTVKLLSDALHIPLTSYNLSEVSRMHEAIRKKYRLRRKLRIIFFAVVLVLLVFILGVLLVDFDARLFGLPKKIWAPLVYVLLFLHLIGIALYWRCPSCNSLLGDVFNQQYYSRITDVCYSRV
jgi:transcriptional regulator with XRE-family HTH domain